MAELISVVMPVYNGALYVAEAIESVLRQTWSNFELLIMDDGSTDATPAILRRYAEQDGRIRLFPRPRQGQIACRNELIQLAKSEIVACADADDVCLPDRLERQLRAMRQDRDLWVLGTGIISVDGNGRRRRRWRVTTGSAAVAAELERACCIAHPSCMLRKSHILGMGGYRPAYECAEDYDLFLRASERGKVDNLPMVGVIYRRHGDNVSHRHAVRQAISADLARATHLLRAAGKPDPTEGLPHPPELGSPMLAALLPPEAMEAHRAMSAAFDPDVGAGLVDSALAYFLRARIGKKQARTHQRALLHLVRRRPLDRRSLVAVARAVTLGPGRFVRLLLAELRCRRSKRRLAPGQVAHP